MEPDTVDHPREDDRNDEVGESPAPDPEPDGGAADEDPEAD
jgi:hypothetical protein